jgi:hypothetical protein
MHVSPLVPCWYIGNTTSLSYFRAVKHRVRDEIRILLCDDGSYRFAMNLLWRSVTKGNSDPPPQ